MLPTARDALTYSGFPPAECLGELRRFAAQIRDQPSRPQASRLIDACGLRWLPFRTIGTGNGAKPSCSTDATHARAEAPRNGIGSYPFGFAASSASRARRSALSRLRFS